jgi:hypothetical protein
MHAKYAAIPNPGPSPLLTRDEGPLEVRQEGVDVDVGQYLLRVA